MEPVNRVEQLIRATNGRHDFDFARILEKSSRSLTDEIVVLGDDYSRGLRHGTRGWLEETPQDACPIRRLLSRRVHLGRRYGHAARAALTLSPPRCQTRSHRLRLPTVALNRLLLS